MYAIRSYYAPDAFELPDDLLAHAAKQRRGFDHFNGTEDSYNFV